MNNNINSKKLVNFYNNFFKNLDKNLKKYFYKNQLDKILKTNFKKNNIPPPFQTFDQEGSNAFPCDIYDLTRLHKIIVSLKVISVLELGSGESTRIMADALRINEKNNLNDSLLMKIRKKEKFKIHSIETEKKYLQITERKTKAYQKYVKYYHTGAIKTQFNDNICGRYKTIPPISANLIYIDGPSPYSYNKKNLNYIDLGFPEITNITCDLLLMEPFLLPGTVVIFDGLTNNAYFNIQRLKRNWLWKHNLKFDYTIMALIDKPLGIHNINELKFQKII